MTKTLTLPETIYDDLVSLSEELTLMAKKPISLSMAVYLLMSVYRAHMSNPCARDIFGQQLASLKLLSPGEFDKTWDDVPSKKEVGTKKTA
jgi:hypothetical protein